jgi:hypothetical protein
MSILGDFSWFHWNAESATLAVIQEPRIPSCAIGDWKQQTHSTNREKIIMTKDGEKQCLVSQVATPHSF